mmetsp:Transcript_34453/g.81220  ORF Transcript_34453/g.81220 Transcript_34453/m.81220 type:complete len:265 (+) Transcript_34453:1729-2523(+)
MLVLFLLQFLHCRFGEFGSIGIMRGNSVVVKLGVLAFVLRGFLEEVLGVDLHAGLLCCQVCLLLGFAGLIGFILALAERGLLLVHFFLERDGAVEDQSARSVGGIIGRVHVDYKVSHSLELEGLVRLDRTDVLLVYQRKDGRIDECVFINDFGFGVKFFLPQIGGLRHGEQMVVDTNLAGDRGLSRDPADPGLWLDAILGFVQSALEFLDLRLFLPTDTFLEDDLVANQVSAIIFETDRFVWRQSVIFGFVYQTEITGVNVQSL